MENIVSVGFDLASFSAIMVLMVTGLGVIASMMGVFNFAHGEFLLLGAYTVYLTHSYGYPVWAGMVAAPFAVALVGLALERGVIRFFYTEPVVAMLGTYAIGLVIRESVRGLIGAFTTRCPIPSSARSASARSSSPAGAATYDPAHDGVGIPQGIPRWDRSIVVDCGPVFEIRGIALAA